MVSHPDAPRAFRSLQGRNIYDGCCQIGIELLPVSPGSDAAKLTVMAPQATAMVEAPQQDAEAKVQQEPEAAQACVGTAAASAVRGTTARQPRHGRVASGSSGSARNKNTGVAGQNRAARC